MISAVQLESILPHAILLLFFTFFITTLTGLCQLPWKFWLGSSVTIMFVTIDLRIVRENMSDSLIGTSLLLGAFIIMSAIGVGVEADEKASQSSRRTNINHNKPQEAKKEEVKSQSNQDQPITEDDTSPAK